MGNHHESHKKQGILFCILFVALHLLPFSTLAQETSNAIVLLSDYQALLAFKREVDPRGVFLRSWNGTRNGACSGAWTGVKCVNGQVIALQLPFKGLGGRIAPQIGLLRGLRKLSLHDNFLTGVIPSSIGLLPNLRGLHLFNNRLSGLIPVTIGKNPNLQNVDLSNNFLVGSIPVSLGSAAKLYRLNLSYNSLSGSIPDRVYVSPSLTFLALEHNNFSGSIGINQKESKNTNSNLQVMTLDYNHFSGNIPHSLSNLGNLQVLSLSHNLLSGSIPDELSSLKKLQVLDFSSNSINGTLPPSLTNLSSLVTLNLGKNHLEGKIPAAMANLSSLNLLDLSGNNFTGEIPASISTISNLTSFNVSYNSLSGEVPSVLKKKFKSSAFIGNLQLCGYSSSSPCPISPTPEISPSSSLNADEAKSHHHHKRKLRIKDIILILIGSILVVLLLLCCVLLCCLIRKKTASKARNGGGGATTSGVQKEVVAAAAGSGGGGDGGKLVLFDGPFVFSADDLLCATAEIMGKNAYGTVYKATLEDGNQVAVKRLREKLAKNPKEFEIEVAELGRIRHPNLLPLRAYYLGPKGEKLLVFDYLSKGSLSSFLHGHGPETTIGWPIRMKIAMGIARGLHHLHVAESTSHGSLTASEVYLDDQDDAKISDYGVSRLMTESANTTAMETSVNGDEMLNTLKLALHLVDPSPEARPEIQEVVQQLEEINPKLAAETSSSMAVEEKKMLD
ncbi:hypothetical protein V2J09_018588 [Rumex salicifolius]